MFCRYVLRTTDDVGAARRFYADAIGLELPDGSSAGSILEAWPLHERARAAGAPPHWLGQIAVSDVEASVSGLLAHGSERLGPTVHTQDGASYATARDPAGAVVAVRGGSTAVGEPPVAWHQHHATDLERTWPVYAELFGWARVGTIEAADPAGGHLLFAWSASGEPVGSMASTARWEGVHAHWLFHFAVPDVGAAAARVRERGGTAMASVALPGGMRLAACEDPTGAAFGIAQLA